jgi:hypothetical protein
MKRQKKPEQDRLIRGIRSIISENRCSLLDSEICLLEECVITLKSLNDERVKKKKIDLMINLCSIFIKLYNSELFDQIKHFF